MAIGPVQQKYKEILIIITMKLEFEITIIGSVLKNYIKWKNNLNLDIIQLKQITLESS